MRRAMTYVVVAALSGAGIGVSITRAANPAPAATSAQQTPKLPNGFQLKDLGQLNDVRDHLGRVVDDAMSKDFGKVVGDLTVDGKDRMQNWKDEDFKTLYGVVDQLNKQWNQKFGHDFNIRKMNSGSLWTDQYVIVQGVVTNPTVAAQNFPVPQSSGSEARIASGRQPANSQVQQVRAQDLKDSSGVAIAQFPQIQNTSGVTASLINEKSNGWRVDVPDDITAQQLHTQLQNHLSYFSKNVAGWPNDEKQAYLDVAHHVFMALYNEDVPSGRR